MANVYDVADLFIELAQNDENDTITNLRLNMLLYISHAYHLVKYNTPLFEDNIEAWDLGPVISSIYQKYKTYKESNIDKLSCEYSDSNFTSEEIDTLTEVMFNFGKYSITELVNQTHQDGSPWKNVYVQGKRNIINNDSIKEYYSKVLPLTASIAMPKWMLADVEIPRRTPQGTAIIDEDWD